MWLFMYSQRSTGWIAGCATRQLHLTPQWQKVVSFNLSDIGEGIREVTVKEW